MKTIAFYISNHGFGHATRNIPIIEKLLNIDCDLKVIIKTDTVQLEFIKQSLKNFNSRIDFYDERVDLGLILKENSPAVDKEKLRCELIKFISTWNQRIAKEESFLKENKVDFVVSDIVPWVFEAAANLNIKSLLISNFTWVEIYKEWFYDDIVKNFENCYKKANYVFEYPLADNINLVTQKVGMSCRKFNQEAAKCIKHSFKNPLIFVSLGRSVDLDGEIDVEDLPYDFVYTEGIRLKGKNAHKLQGNTINTQDYIKASEIIITKAGWSTVSEAICARKPMIVLNRPEIKEDKNTVSKLLKLKIAESINFNQLNSNNLKTYIEETKKLEDNYKFLDKRYKNSSKEIARKILELL